MATFIINTVLLEKNRWEPGRVPTIKVSEWMKDFRRDGFSGVELWENHALKASEEETRQLKNAILPVDVFNSYAGFEDEKEQERKETAEMVRKLGASNVKFNIGADENKRDTYVKNVLEWKEQLPSGCMLLCECHSGTLMEDPQTAAQVFNEWGSNQFGAILHPFHAHTDLDSWFAHLGSTIVHAHVSLYADGAFQLLEEQPELVKERVRKLKKAGFDGTYSMEFTKGTALEREIPMMLYENALKDMDFLSTCLKEV
ncbi:sugar phosphate isomerase/epimerase family protein [Pseudalkalibacillus caeni]|uniref:Xylose isomerase-like TIM barrel domain-containing protein n=1 Tax=Exobacillus caeni TaxID=2574798 RepID=A0A5R9F4D5_9BACL|nr:TIM barrel protein [Pseudalkalibacillus caeni]TLS37216.1 hypothetical protein FCL54_11865 [Pseudalkalibacillus caeni]